MKTDITIHVDMLSIPGQDIQIYPGNVEGADLPLPIYIAILSALKDAQERINTTEQVFFVEQAPQEVQTDDRINDLWEHRDELPNPIRRALEESPVLPPQSPKTVVSTKMRKAYTEDEKTEIAELYRDGRPVNEIASKFGRKPDSIYKLLSSMGVKRRKYEKPEVIAGSDASDPPKAKRECTLKKPWYLQRQTPNNRDKT